VLAIVGTITVPIISVPTATAGNGSCDGIGSYNYWTSWWLGLGGDGRVNTYANGTDNALFQAGVAAYVACTQGNTVPATPVYQVFEEIPEQEAPIVLGTVNAGAVITIQVTSSYNAVSGDPEMTWIMTGDFMSNNSDIATFPDARLPKNTAEGIVERNFPGALPMPGVPAYAYPVPYSLSGAILSATTYTTQWIDYGYSGTKSRLALNSTYGTADECANNTNLCMRPFLSNTNANPCDALAAAKNGARGGGASYVYEGPAQSVNNYFCLTNYVD
jgi:hypothetical protein